MNKPNICRFALLSPCLVALLSAGLATAHPVTTTNNNSSFVLSHTDPSIVGSLPFTGEWFVDGRRILTYVSSPANVFDIGSHHHADAHVDANQIHARGSLLGDTNFAGNIFYTLNGGAVGSGRSRLEERVDLTLGTGITTPQSFNLSGFGFEPRPHGDVTFEIPDLTGLSITGATAAFFGSKILLHAFTGFNTFSEDIVLDPGTTLRMVTELNVAPGPVPPPAFFVPSDNMIALIHDFTGFTISSELMLNPGITVDVARVPEPSSLLLVAAGLALVVLSARRSFG